MEVRNTKTTEYTLEELRQIIRAGQAAEHLQPGAQIMVKFDGTAVPYDVIGLDAEELVDPELKHSVTIQAHTLIEERPFDTKGRYGSNIWETSELREYLNSKEFADRYEDLAPYLAAVYKKNTSGNITEDKFFLLSAEEYEPGTTPYEYYKNRANRVKMDEDGYTDWHLTRSAYRGYSYSVWYVLTSGYVGTSGGAHTAYRCAPACVIA